MTELPSNNPVTTAGGKTAQPWAHWFNAVHQTVSAVRQSGATAQRPTKGLWIGRQFFDTTLGRPVYVQSVNPVVWVDSAGVVV